MDRRIPTGFRPGCYRAVGLFLIYGIIILIPSGNLAPVFLPLGAMVVAGRLYGLLTHLKRPNPSSLGSRQKVSAIAADLVFLIAAQHGLIHTRIELDRGNLLGAILSFGLVTPILSLLARTFAFSVGTRLFRF